MSRFQFQWRNLIKSSLPLLIVLPLTVSLSLQKILDFVMKEMKNMKSNERFQPFFFLQQGKMEINKWIKNFSFSNPRFSSFCCDNGVLENYLYIFSFFLFWFIILYKRGKKFFCCLSLPFFSTLKYFFAYITIDGS